nr:GIY-YIG nuclease family protein [Echinimonas agarilytica]
MFYQHACDELGLEVIETAVNKLIQRPALPPNLPADELDSLPNSAGVYRFWGEEGALLYVGKSINIYQRVMSHFQDDHRLHKSQRLSQQLFHIDFTQTAGDLGAQLLELKEIKSLQPIHNRRSRAAKELKTVQLLENDDGYLKAHIVSSIDSSNLNQFFGIFKTVKEAEKAIKGLCQSYQLCPQLCGLEQGQGACFSRQLDKCKGACESLEAAVNYNVRAQLAFQGLKLKSWPWDGPIAIHEHDDFTNISASYVIWNWIHMTTVSNEQDLFEWVENNAHDSLEHVSFDKDCYQLLQRYLFSGKNKPQVTLLNVQ